jgi:hypothetical protein
MINEGNYGTNETLSVLNKIQDMIRVSKEGDLIIYRIENFYNQDAIQTIKSAKEDEIICDLERWGAIKIEQNERLDNEMVYYLKILPKFKETYLDHTIEKNQPIKVSIELVFEGQKLYDKDDPNVELLLKETGLGYKILKKLRLIPAQKPREILCRKIAQYTQHKFKSLKQEWARFFKCTTPAIGEVITDKNRIIRASKRLTFL